MKVLSIDAWREGSSWQWNNWFNVGKISHKEFETLTTPRKIIAWFRERGYIGDNSKGKVAIEDDEYNIIIMAKGTREPLFAIEYGPEIN